MEKTWMTSITGGTFKTYDDAVEKAKRKLGGGCGFDSATIYESVAVIKTPVPEYEVVKL